MSEHVRVERNDGRCTITLARPPLNVVTIEMLDAIESALAEADRDSSVRVVLIAGDGKAFSAGVDVQDHIGDRLEPMMDALTRLFSTMERIDVPTVSAVHGAVLGGGLELALGTRLCLARDDAKIGQPEIRLGVFAPPASVLLPRLIGPRRAHDLLLRGGTIDAATALDWGLVNAVFPADGFRTGIDDWCDRLASLSGSSLRLAVRAIREAGGRTADEAHVVLRDLYLQHLMPTEDAREGLAAFQEKRPPVWRHR
jgi:cyclohexa-1,5-dienecarbonyl-CoA hydratase